MSLDQAQMNATLVEVAATHGYRLRLDRPISDLTGFLWEHDEADGDDVSRDTVTSLLFESAQAVRFIERDGQRLLALHCRHKETPKGVLPLFREETEAQAIQRALALLICQHDTCESDAFGPDAYVFRKTAGMLHDCPECGRTHVLVSLHCRPVASNVTAPWWSIIGGEPEPAPANTPLWYWHEPTPAPYFRPVLIAGVLADG